MEVRLVMNLGGKQIAVDPTKIQVVGNDGTHPALHIHPDRKTGVILEGIYFTKVERN